MSVWFDAMLAKMLAAGEKKTVQNRLKTLEKRGFTQPEIATLLGVDESSVYRWIEGERTPRGNQTHRLLDFIEDKLDKEALINDIQSY